MAPTTHARHGSMSGGPRIEMMPNPDFSFPMQPHTTLSSRQDANNDSSRRPASMHINLPAPQSAAGAHRRATSNLPSFSFNAMDASGLTEDTKTPPETPDESVPVTPPRRGHRRGGSELVGGDSRFGVSNAVSSSPTKTSALPVPESASAPQPTPRHGHAHRRSAAMSSHDVGTIMHPTELQPRLSSSLPNTPLEHPSEVPPFERQVSSPELHGDLADPFGPSLDDIAARPPSRPRVGFSDNIEYIPRPLSTISSETESSVSTILGHSVNNSISSVLSLSTPSPPSTRILPSPRTTLSTAVEDEEKPRARSSLEISRRIEKEGEWLKSRPGSLKRPWSESAMAPLRTTFVEPEPPIRDRAKHKKKHSISHALGFDRRRSEPTIGMNAGEPSRLSAISLQESDSSVHSVADGSGSRAVDHRSSTRRIKQWAASKLSKKTKEVHKALTASSSTSSIRPESAGSVSVPGQVPMSPPIAETDLDTVFSGQDDTTDSQRPSSPSKLRVDSDTPPPSQQSSASSRDFEDFAMVDLDAALGPMKTPPIGSQRQRKELHSSRLTKDFSGPGGHYHRRTESAPLLSPFESGRIGTPSQSSMADVFEEEEEDETLLGQRRLPAGSQSEQDDETGVGVQIVDLDSAAQMSTFNWVAEDGLGIQRGEWEPDRPTTSHGNSSSKLSTSGTERRGSSIAEETIYEEVSPGEGVEIVEAHEEPRTSSLTKSSDSSETPTILAPPMSLLPLPDGQQSLTTPDTLQTSTFSSPDFGRRQGSFDTSRLGTSASSMTDNRTMSSCTTGEQLRVSVDDVPSLTSSRSTMLSTMHANSSRREFGGDRNSSASSGALDSPISAERRRKRGSIQSLSQLVGGSFSSKSKSTDELRPHTAADSISALTKTPKKEHRLKKLMFWKSKHHSKQSLPAS